MDSFAVNENMGRLGKFVYAVRRLLFRLLNRSSQRRSMDWAHPTICWMEKNFMLLCCATISWLRRAPS